MNKSSFTSQSADSGQAGVILRISETQFSPAAVPAGEHAALGVDDEGAVVAAHDLPGNRERRGQERGGGFHLWGRIRHEWHVRANQSLAGGSG